MNWYSIRVISGKERKIQEAINWEIEDQGLQEDIQEVFVPTEKIVEMKDGKKKVKIRVFFPGYVLINMNLTSTTRYLVENVNNVLNFVGPKGKPQAMRPEEITRIVGAVEKGEEQEVFQNPFKVGDTIRVVDGPFMDFSGFIQEINNEKQKLKVSVSIFGRPTPIELDFLQVEIEK
ncbi:MAG: transcription termination/antitermination protein NusG [Candidatus Marinimicrobia bacterium]|jgi:transcriptional antiterminator NusG|nr:transcription termination/antitermination protein NusG [Candidatus Neomarinimicrobiota bacterium]